MTDEDDTKAYLEKLLAELYAKTAAEPKAAVGNAASWLVAADDQYLGTITDNKFDTKSIINDYGPHGSPYSPTSIFNEYSKYGSPYAQYSINNPYTTQAPRLYLQGRLVGVVTANEYAPKRIATKAFLYALKNNIRGLMAGQLPRDEDEVRVATGEVYVQAADGTFLGKLSGSKYDTDSLFNKYGLYGNKYATNSIFNKYGSYGGAYSLYSPYNARTLYPPVIVQKGKQLAFLTINESKTPRVHPDDLLEWASRNVRRN